MDQYVVENNILSYLVTNHMPTESPTDQEKKGQESFTFDDNATLVVNWDQKLGQGSYGAVYACTYYTADGKIADDNAAVKVPYDSKGEDVSKETKLNKIQGTLYEQSKVGDQLFIVMPNLGKPIPNALMPGQKLTDTIVPESDEPSLQTNPNQNSDSQKNVVNDDTDPSSPTGSVDVNDEFSSVIRHDDTEPDSPTGSVDVNDEFSSVIRYDDTDSGSPTGSVDVNDEFSSVIRYDEDTTGSVDRHDENSAGSVISKQTPGSEDKPAPKSQFDEYVKNLKEKGEQNILAQPATSALAKQQQVALSKEKPPLREISCDFTELSTDLESTFDIFEKMAAEVDRTHKNGILHLDIKGENFLHDRTTNKVTLIDYGVSELISDNKDKQTVGSPCWMSPELMVMPPQGKFSTAQDVYSLGRTYVMALAEQLGPLNPESFSIGPPIEKKHVAIFMRKLLEDMPQLENIQFKNTIGHPDIIALNKLITLMNDMTATHPDNRPSMSTVLQEIKTIQAEWKQNKANTNVRELKETMNELEIVKTNAERYLEALQNVQFQGNKVVDRFLTKNAIEEYNRHQAHAGNQADPLPVPSNQSLDMMVEQIREVRAETLKAEKDGKEAEQGVMQKSKQEIKQDTKQQLDTPSPLVINFSKQASSISVATPKQSEPNKVNQSITDVTDLIKNISHDVEAYKQDKQRATGQKAITHMMARFGGGVKDAAVRISENLIENLKKLMENNKLGPQEKLDALKTILENAQEQHLAISCGNLSKGENSPLGHICKDNLDKVNKALGHEVSKSQKESKLK